MLPAAALEPEEPNNRTQAHVMMIGSLRKRRALCNVIDHTCAQIVRIWLRHSCWPPRPSAKLESDSVALVNPERAIFRFNLFGKRSKLHSHPSDLFQYWSVPQIERLYLSVHP